MKVQEIFTFLLVCYIGISVMIYTADNGFSIRFLAKMFVLGNLIGFPLIIASWKIDEWLEDRKTNKKKKEE